MNLLYLVFGNEFKNHLQAHFSICSFLTQGKAIDSINVLTDKPEFYRSLANSINITEVNQATLQEWKGKHDFFWRVKIKAIELIGNTYPGKPVLYIDSDTFLFQPVTTIAAGVQQGRAYMHELENALSEARSKTEKRMWRQVSGKQFGGVTITEKHAMWNAGVVLSPNTRQEMALALSICDDMCEAGVTRRLIEQYAISVSLSELYDLQEAKDSIAHYWSNKEEWNLFISYFFAETQFRVLTREEVIARFSQLDLKQIPVTKKLRNTSIRLQRLVERMYPPRETKFIP